MLSTLGREEKECYKQGYTQIILLALDTFTSLNNNYPWKVIKSYCLHILAVQQWILWSWPTGKPESLTCRFVWRPGYLIGRMVAAVHAGKTIKHQLTIYNLSTPLLEKNNKKGYCRDGHCQYWCRWQVYKFDLLLSIKGNKDCMSAWAFSQKHRE